MKSFAAAALVAPALLLLPPACGGAVSGQYGDKCEIACKAPAGPCDTQDPTDCQKACVTATEGLSVACAQCIAENTGWHGQKCTCAGANCQISSFGSGDVSNGGTSGGGPACDPVADSKCSGFKIESITASDCKSVCAVMTK